LLAVIGLAPSGSSTVPIYTQTIPRATQLILEECGPCPVFKNYTLAFALQLRKKYGETSVRVVLLGNQLKYYNPRYEGLNYEITFPMKVLRHINNERLLPSKEEVPNRSTTNNNSKTQPYIVASLTSLPQKKIIPLRVVATMVMSTPRSDSYIQNLRTFLIIFVAGNTKQKREGILKFLQPTHTSGCTWSVRFSDEHGLQEFENRMLRKMIRRKGRKKSRRMDKITECIASRFALRAKHYQRD